MRSRSPKRDCVRGSSSPTSSRPPTLRWSPTCAERACATSPPSTTPTSSTLSTSPRWRCRCSTRSPRPACTRATPRSASCCGRRRCCTTLGSASVAGAGLRGGGAGGGGRGGGGARLPDLGVGVDYDPPHRHSRYLILNAGLPGFAPREVALIAQMARYHRKGTPSLGELKPLMRKGDQELLDRCSALLRVAEQLERSRDQSVHEAHVEVEDGGVRLALVADEQVPVAQWAAERQSDVFERAFGRTLEIVGPG